MRAPVKKTVRRGVVLAEAVIVIVVFLMLVFGMMDLGIAIFRHSVISQAARHGARQASVHGALATPGWNGGPWGPATITVGASASGNYVADAVSPMLSGCNLSLTNITVEWPEGSNELKKPVRVTVTTSYNPLMTFIFGNPTFSLSASSTMLITH